MNSTLAIVLLTILSVSAWAQDASTGRTASGIAQPFWKSTVMVGESVLFVKRGGKAATAQLLFAPTKILEVHSSSGAITYQPDKDYRFTAGSNVITVPAGSAIPV